MSDLSKVKGVGKATEDKLLANEIDTIEKLANSDIQAIVKMSIGKSTAIKIIESAKMIFAEQDAKSRLAKVPSERNNTSPYNRRTREISTTVLGVIIILAGILSLVSSVFIFYMNMNFISIAVGIGSVLVSGFLARRFLNLKEYQDKIHDSKIFIVYIHGVGEQRISFADLFHRKLKSLIASHTAYSENELDDHLIKIPIYWFDELKTVWKEKKKESYKNQYIGSIDTNYRAMLYWWIAGIILIYLLTSISTLVFAEWSLIGLVILGIAFILFYRNLVNSILPGIVTNQSYNLLDPVARELVFFGDRDNRNGIRNKINEEIKTIAAIHEIEKPNVCFITHSLGTVIAFDFLFQTGYFYHSNSESPLDPKIGRRDLHIAIRERNPPSFILKLIVTMGSPLPLFFKDENNPETLYLRPIHFGGEYQIGHDGTRTLIPFNEEDEEYSKLIDDLKWANYFDPDDFIARKFSHRFLKLNHQLRLNKEINDLQEAINRSESAIYDIESLIYLITIYLSLIKMVFCGFVRE